MNDLRQNPFFSSYLKSLGWKTDKVQRQYLYSMKLPLVGISVTKLQRPSKIVPVAKVKEVARKRKSYVVFVEPSTLEQADYYAAHGFCISRTPSLPTKTIQIDLSKSEACLKKSLHHKTRYNIGLSQRRGVSVINSVDISMFCNLWDASAKRRRSFISQKKDINSIYRAFGGNAYILYAKRNEELLAGILLLKSDKVLYYMYAFSTEQGNALFAPTLLVWEALKLGKKSQCKTFDFEGVFDERYPLPAWKGFTRFKKSFGGKEIIYPYIYRKFYLPF